ncbi:cytochrome C oxidase subunit IV family protein [Sphingobacteriaceae bacterium WQ 2009]|uniref:Cytochrome C oxidase subunit IV family protein n=1 Tax=Rhinopithecimicrobium faecis TaxID=2820698 RepID=A0A8T4H7T4_9SPHI|nr:cytochrome C oxidase subunit IV family protein [Sphingobacteriaceae bacterium WQ 2009]
MSNHDHTAGHDAHEHGEGMDKKGIWKIFFILLALTALEFFIALALVHKGILAKGALVNTIYIVLTLVKAYYIVAYFMHLKFEKSGFIITCGIVFIFIIYFIILMLTEGHFLLSAFQTHEIFPNN